MAKFISLFMVPDNKLIYVNPDYIKVFCTAERAADYHPMNTGTCRLELIKVTVLDIYHRGEIWVKETPEEILGKLSDDDGLSRPGNLP